MSLRAFRVGVVGARRAREGTGAHLARFLDAAGAKVVAVAGTTPSTAEVAARALRAEHGIEATPHAGAAAMVDAERLDALVIASPDETHREHLELALSRGLHVLCEKPLVWGTGDFVEAGARLVRDFSERGLCLVVAAQWRHALGAYMRLFPDVAPRTASRFTMHLSPAAAGVAMVPAAMPHPLSLLDHLYPAAEPGLRDVVVDLPSDGEVRVTFVHPGRGGVPCEVRLARAAQRPRAVAFGFDGRLAHRVVREPGYRTWLATADGGREVVLPDPLEALVRDFVARVRKGPPFPADPTLAPGLHHLRDVLRAWPRTA